MEELLDLRVADPVNAARATFIVLRQGHPLSDPARAADVLPYRLGVSALNGVSGVWMPIIVVPEEYDGPVMHLNARYAPPSLLTTEADDGELRCGDSVADGLLVEQFKIKQDPRVLMPVNLSEVQEIARFGNYGGYMTSRTLQDWVVSRQRAWGTPIPMVLSADGKTAVPLSDDKLPLLQGQEAGTRVACDRLDAGEGSYEADTLDTFFDSAWYYLRYLDPGNQEAVISREAAEKMPVDIYVGGIEHAAVHMFFARFLSYFLCDIGVTHEPEPFRDLIPQGIVRGKTFLDPDGRYVQRSEAVAKGNVFETRDGRPLSVAYEKMSKSKGNGVDPLEVLDKVGVDMARLQLLDSAAPRQAINWEESDLKGLKKWLDRVAWVVSTYVEQRKRLADISKETSVDARSEEKLRENYNFFVRNTSMCLEVLNLHNTALARLQGFTNALRVGSFPFVRFAFVVLKLEPAVLGSSPEAERCVYALVTMMQVFTPYLAAELWAALQSVPAVRAAVSPSCLLTGVPWPQVDPDCEIDFILVTRLPEGPSKGGKVPPTLSCLAQVNDIGCGRVPVPRQQIEHLSVQELIERAMSQEHKDIFEKFEEKGFTCESFSTSIREGFHVTVNVSLRGEVDPREISLILNELQRKWRTSKAKKRVEAEQ
uniref:leucine--tRNA ligase n=1 Tax=Heligmosomoides polygyrus TaxID=6339 RepID=A0A183G6W3_HELPZ